jgi:lipoprotein-anchoring transpeptidase ErfK/SrfK
MCAGHDLRYDSPVTTGAVGLPYDSTPVGTFHVQAKDTDTVLTLVGGAQYTVRYWIPFDAPLFGFHDAAWQKMPFGSQQYRTRGSHGCVHMPLAAMRFLYHWARVGATVRVRR